MCKGGPRDLSHLLTPNKFQWSHMYTHLRSSCCTSPSFWESPDQIVELGNRWFCCIHFEMWLVLERIHLATASSCRLFSDHWHLGGLRHPDRGPGSQQLLRLLRIRALAKQHRVCVTSSTRTQIDTRAHAHAPHKHAHAGSARTLVSGNQGRAHSLESSLVRDSQ